MTIDPLVYARRWKTLAVLSLSLVIIGLDNTILNVALPSLQEVPLCRRRGGRGRARRPALVAG